MEKKRRNLNHKDYVPNTIKKIYLFIEIDIETEIIKYFSGYFLYVY